jgi:hypothetical protein
MVKFQQRPEARLSQECPRASPEHPPQLIRFLSRPTIPGTGRRRRKVISQVVGSDLDKRQVELQAVDSEARQVERQAADSEAVDLELAEALGSSSLGQRIVIGKGVGLYMTRNRIPILR